jgi:type IV pilus assembly protein PilA
MKNCNSGFTLIELLIVIAIIGILATIAIPYYKGYIIRAKLVEVEHAMVQVQSAVSAYRQENSDSWPNCPTINEIRNSLGIGLAAVTRISSLSIDSATGVITATVDNIHTMVNGKTITLTPTLKADGSFSWTWGWSADFPMQFRPKP